MGKKALEGDGEFLVIVIKMNNGVDDNNNEGVLNINIVDY